MLYNFLFAPFSDSVRQQQYEQVQAALQADTSTPVSLLLGNFSVADEGESLDAVIVRPHSITIVLFVERGGRLNIPVLEHGAWKLDGQPLHMAATDADNPFKQFRRHKEALAAWLAPQFEPQQANFQFISGLVVFAAPIAFGPEVEEKLSSQPGGNFQLLADAAHVPRRLKQLARPEIDFTDDDLTVWARGLAEQPATAAEPVTTAAAYEPTSPPPAAGSLWGRMWRWLGADDISDDTPYGQSTNQVAASSAEKQRLEQLRLEAQVEVRQQLQALEAREAEREQSMAELRAQLAQAAPVTTEAQALREQLAVESREKVALEEAIRTSRAESEARSQDLDAKIQQLGGLIEQLHARAAAPTPPGAAPVVGSGGLVHELRPSFTPIAQPLGYRNLRAWRRRAPRVAALLGVVGVLGLGVWGVSRLTSDPPAPYQENGKWGFADEDGTPVVPARYSSVGSFQEKRALVEENGVYGMIDATGKPVVPLAYDALNPYAGGYARVRVGDMYTFIDEQGQEFDTYYFNALDFSEEYAAVLDHRGWYYITGPEEPSASPVLFREAYAFHDGLARVKLADGYTFITKDYFSNPSEGTKPFARYETATDFDHEKAQVTQNGRRFTIDTSGDPIE